MMNPHDFCYWFQGFAELTPNPPDAGQWDLIRAKISEVSHGAKTEISGPLKISFDPKSVEKFANEAAASVKRANRRVA